MSMPTSRMAATAAGLIVSAGAEPAERTSTASPARWRSQPAAIWERPALWTQTNRTLGLSLMMIRFLQACRLSGRACGLIGVADDHLVGGAAGVRVQHKEQPGPDQEPGKLGN